jgi:TRAP-type C4-dicarboxylate transport system permease small subunit
MFNCPDDCLPEGVPNKPIPDVLEDTAKWLLGFAVMASVVILIWGGVYYVSSSGDEQKTQTAKKLVKYSLMGILVVGISYAVIYVLDKIFAP